MRANWKTTSYFGFGAITDPATRPDGVKRCDVEVAAVKDDAPVAPEIQLQNARALAEERIGPVALISVEWAGTTSGGSITAETTRAAEAICTATGFPLAVTA
jgi:hypothetical protein